MTSPDKEVNVLEVAKMLEELASIGMVEDYDRCPGVAAFDIQLTDGRWIQIEVR